MPRYHEILTRLKELVDSGQLRCGDRLPSERVLAETFRVSRNSVREAIRALAERGVLESRPGNGTFVCAQNTDSMENAFEDVFGAQRRKLKDIMEFRRILEPGIAELAAVNATDQDVEKLKILACDQQRQILAGEDDSETDAEFHLQLARASKNEVLAKVLAALEDTIGDSRSDYLRSPERQKASQEAHLRIIDAIIKKNPEECRRAMDDHLLSVGAALSGGVGPDENQMD